MKNNINIEKFLDKFKENYCYLYENDNVEGYGEAVTRFDEFLKNHESFVTEFSKFRGDCISSDREAAAFIFTLNELQQEAHTMKKATYFITKWDSEKIESYIEEIQGYIFEIDGVYFGVHKDCEKSWSVTELSTGILAIRGKAKRKEAVAELEKNVKKIKNILETDESLKKYIDRIKEAYKKKEVA